MSEGAAGSSSIGAPAWVAWRYILWPVVAFRHPVGCRSHAGLRKASTRGSHHGGTEVGSYLRSFSCAASMPQRLQLIARNTGGPPGASQLWTTRPVALRGAGALSTTKPRGQPCTVPTRCLSNTGRLPDEHDHLRTVLDLPGLPHHSPEPVLPAVRRGTIEAARPFAARRGGQNCCMPRRASTAA